MGLYAKMKGPVGYTVVGSPTITNGVASGFSSSNYLAINQQLDTSKPFEVHSPFNLTSLPNANQSIVGIPIYAGLFQVWVNRYGKISFSISTAAGSWNIADMTGRTLSVNTDYIVKAVFTGTAYELYLSLDNGITWNLENSTSSTALVNNGTPINLQIGNSHRDNWYVRGSIDLNNTYIKSNNQLWFGYDFSRVKIRTAPYVRYTVVGTPTITDGVASGFSDSNYLQLDSSFAPTSTWEISTRILIANIGMWYFIGGNGHNIVFGTTLESANYYFKAFFSSNNITWNIGSIIGGEILQSNTTKFVKCGFDGTKYYLESSDDGVTVNDRKELSSTASIVSSILTIGKGFSTNQYFTGSLDLNNTYIKVNGQYWWRGDIQDVETYTLRLGD